VFNSVNDWSYVDVDGFDDNSDVAEGPAIEQQQDSEDEEAPNGMRQRFFRCDGFNTKGDMKVGPLSLNAVEGKLKG
jgi:hypothetical protein